MNTYNIPFGLKFVYFIILMQLKGTVSDAMRTLFNKAMLEGDISAYYAVKKIQKSVRIINKIEFKLFQRFFQIQPTILYFFKFFS